MVDVVHATTTATPTPRRREEKELWWVQRMEDRRHAWCKKDHSPVLLRMRLIPTNESLDQLTFRRLCVASAFHPLPAHIETDMEWDVDDGSFSATLIQLLLLALPPQDDDGERPRSENDSITSPAKSPRPSLDSPM